MVEFEPPKAPQISNPPTVILPPPQARPQVRCELNIKRAIDQEPPEDLWRSLGTMRMGNSECNIWHVGAEYNMTNCHCVGPGERSISVRFARGSNYRNSNCYPVGCHATLDYAVVRCPGQMGQVPPVKFTDPRFSINIGHQVHLLTYDVKYSPDEARFSEGSVIQRAINADGGARMEGFTSRAQGGNSGSAVFNKNGEVTCLLHSIAKKTVDHSGYSRLSYCTSIHSILSNMSRQGGELALAREAIRHSQNAIQLAERSCSGPSSRNSAPPVSSTFSAGGGIR